MSEVFEKRLGHLTVSFCPKFLTLFLTKGLVRMTNFCEKVRHFSRGMTKKARMGGD